MKQIDYDLINSFPQLGLYQSKAAIASYAEEHFGLKIQRNLSYENMQKKLEEFVAANHVETDSERKKSFVLGEHWNDDELDAATLRAADEITSAIDSETIKKIVDLAPKTLMEEDEITSMAKVVSTANDRKTQLMSLLPPDFKPCFTPMGNVEMFYPLSYWINDWIQDTPDWTSRINEYERVQEHKFLYTLIYYIALHGKFTIRETRNGEHVTLS